MYYAVQELSTIPRILRDVPLDSGPLRLMCAISYRGLCVGSLREVRFNDMIYGSGNSAISYGTKMSAHGYSEL